MPVSRRTQSELATKIAETSSANVGEKYITTLGTCTCPSRKYRGGVCKHILMAVLNAVRGGEYEEAVEDAKRIMDMRERF